MSQDCKQISNNIPHKNWTVAGWHFIRLFEPHNLISLFAVISWRMARIPLASAQVNQGQMQFSLVSSVPEQLATQALYRNLSITLTSYPQSSRTTGPLLYGAQGPIIIECSINVFSSPYWIWFLFSLSVLTRHICKYAHFSWGVSSVQFFRAYHYFYFDR